MGNTPQEEKILEEYAKWLKVRRGNSDSSIETAIRYTSLFIEWLHKNDLELDDISQEIVDDYLLYSRNKYAKNTMVPLTVNLRKLCQFLEKNIDVKVASVKAPNREKQPLTKDEVKRIFKTVQGNPLEEAILKTLYYTGMREQELLNLDLEDIDFDRQQITIKHGKGDRRRIVNITDDCAQAIKRWLQERPQPKEDHEKALFVSTYKQRPSKTYLWELVKRTAAKAGIKKKVYPHLYRVTNLTHLAEAGLSPKEMQQQSGHHCVDTLMRYIQHSSQRVKDSYERALGDVSENRDKTQEDNPEPTEKSGNEEYKKIATQKYLDGEIDVNTLSSILSTLEDDTRDLITDPSYQ